MYNCETWKVMQAVMSNLDNFVQLLNTKAWTACGTFGRQEVAWCQPIKIHKGSLYDNVL